MNKRKTAKNIRNNVELLLRFYQANYIKKLEKIIRRRKSCVTFKLLGSLGRSSSMKLSADQKGVW